MRLFLSFMFEQSDLVNLKYIEEYKRREAWWQIRGRFKPNLSITL